jgi:ABC-type transporter Mla subunit MlaD
MPRQRNELAAGLFILVSIALIIAVVVGVKGLTELTEPTRTFRARFALDADVGGLQRGAEVRLGGTRAGSVRAVEIETDAQDNASVVVEFSLASRFVVREDAVIRVREALTGAPVLNIESLGAGKPLADGGTLAGQPGAIGSALTTLAELVPDLRQIVTEVRGVVADVRGDSIPRAHALLDSATKTADSLRETSDRARALIEHVGGKVDPVVERYNAVADRSAEAAAHLRDILGDTKTDFRTTMSNISGATATFNERLPRLFDRVDEVAASVKSALGNAETALREIQDTATTAKGATDAARSILAGNRGKIDAMILSLRNTSSNLENASAEIRRSPWRLLYQPKRDELSNLDLFDTARQFAVGATQLNDAATALRDALSDPRVDAARLAELMQDLDRKHQSFEQAQRELFERIK